MGLRLYQAPVESDIQSKSASEKVSARARSSIRRGTNFSPSDYASSRTSDQITARRRRRVANAAAAASSGAHLHPAVYYTSEHTGSRSPLSDAPAPTGSTPDEAATTEGGPRAIRNMGSRLGIWDDRIAVLIGERWAHLHSESNPNPTRDSGNNDALSMMAVDPEFLNPPSRRRRLTAVTEPYAISNVRSTLAPAQSVTHAVRSNPYERSVSRFTRAHRLRERERREERMRELERERAEMPWLPSAPSLGGLGDRNRSPSPPPIWDTIQTTLTPDPQPPSVGSSFASASALASVAASQDAATASSRTSFTGPDTAAEEESAPDALEPPSGCDNSDSDDNEDEEIIDSLTRFPSLRSRRIRTYADVTRSSSTEDSTLEAGTSDSMLRIISNLARREDIPDEWWAEAGLSRTLSREASSS